MNGLPPGPDLPGPIQAWLWLNRPEKFLQACTERYGDLFTMRMPLGLTLVHTSRPELVKTAFSLNGADAHAGEANYNIIGPIVGPHSVLVLDGPEHLRQRKLVLPAFHGERMREWTRTIEEIARETIASLPRNRPIALRPAMQRLTLNVILRVVFGVEEGASKDHLVERIAALSAIGRHPFRMFLFKDHELGGLSPWGRMVAARRRLDAAIYEEIASRRAVPDLAERSDILSQLLLARDPDGNPMTDAEVRDELVTLLLAGHETTATSLCWAMDLLLHHPAAYNRLGRELARGRTDYLDATIKEVMRLRPPVIIVERLLKRPIEFGGYELPAGVGVCPNIYLSHRRADTYPDPDSFRPERFLEQSAEPYTWLPFGGGIRRCLGASFATTEMRIVLPLLLSRARIRPLRGPSRILREAVIIVPADGVRVVVRD